MNLLHNLSCHNNVLYLIINTQTSITGVFNGCLPWAGLATEIISWRLITGSIRTCKKTDRCGGLYNNRLHGFFFLRSRNRWSRFWVCFHPNTLFLGWSTLWNYMQGELNISFKSPLLTWHQLGVLNARLSTGIMWYSLIESKQTYIFFTWICVAVDLQCSECVFVFACVCVYVCMCVGRLIRHCQWCLQKIIPHISR